MNLKRLVTCAALLVAAAFPASAAAGAGPYDDYLFPNFLNDRSTRLKYNDEQFFEVNTTAYTTQDDMFDPPASGGPGEPNLCTIRGNEYFYGNTAWAVFYAHRWGRMRVTTAGAFDSLIGIFPFNSPNDPRPHIQQGGCFNYYRTFDEKAPFIVVPGHWYAVQVGGTPPQGGKIQISYVLRKPTKVSGRAFLYGKPNPVRVTRMFVKNVSRDATVKLRCTKGACRKHTVRPAHKVVAGKAAVGTRTAHGIKTVAGPAADTSEGAVFKPIVRSAGRRVNLKKYFGKRVKRGAKIELRITNFGQIGQYYRWKAKRGTIPPPTTRCMKPGSSKPRKKCIG